MFARHKLWVFILFACFYNISYSQVKTNKTDVNHDIDVVRVYEQVVAEGYGTPFIYKKLATAYYFKSEYKKALSWFHMLYSEENNSDPELRQQYKQALKAVALENSKKYKKQLI